MFKSKFNYLIILFSLFISFSAFPYNSCMGGFDVALFKKQVKDSLVRVLKPEDLEKIQLEALDFHRLKLVSETSSSFEIELDANVSSPQFHVTRTSKVLKIPVKDFSDLSLSANDLRYWLVGHELHPYMESSGPIMIKPVQSVAFEAYKEAVQLGAKSFLHVLPTGVGKTLVFTKALVDDLKRRSKEHSIAIVTVDKIDIVNQLSEGIKKEIAESSESLDIQVLNWNSTKQRAEFSQLLSKPSSMAEATVLVITSQSLKNILSDPSSERYKQISERLSAIFIDEAHHLGAELTKEVLMRIQEKSGAFLYGTTATPVHQEVNLRDLFEKVHWSYLNDRGSFFQDHPAEAILRQLSMAIERGDLTSFDNLYFIADTLLTGRESGGRDMENGGNIFVSVNKNKHRVLNPDYYQQLARVIHPILNSNKKGFFVTVTVQEAERLTDFLSRTFPEVEFSAYHYRKTKEEKREIRSRFEGNESSHYLVTVRALDEGINLPPLSAYIDLNVSVPIKQMLQRIGRVLRLYPGKISSDIVLLIDYRNEQIAKDLLNVLNVIKEVSFSRATREEEVSEESASHEDIVLSQPEARPLSREDLIRFQKTLEDIVTSFWRETIEKLPWEEGLKKARGANLSSAEAYQKWQEDHPDMPSNPDQYKPWQAHWKGWPHFLGNERVEKLPWEEGLKKAREANLSGKIPYQKWQEDHPDMPADPSRYKSWQKQGFIWRSWTHFLGNEKLPWEEGLKKAREANLSNGDAYRKWQKDHPDMPNIPRTYKPWKEQGFIWQDWTHFLGNEKKD